MNRFIAAGACLATFLTLAAGNQSFQFIEPQRNSYEIDGSIPAGDSWNGSWIPAHRTAGSAWVFLGSKLLLGLDATHPLSAITDRYRLTLVRVVEPHLYLLQASSAWDSAVSAAALASKSGVSVAVPVMRRDAHLHFPIASAPNDPYYPQQFHLETVDLTSPLLPTAYDLNVREAWTFSRGSQTTVAIADDGVEVDHPDLSLNTTGEHHNFFDDSSDGNHSSTLQDHGTAVAGLIAARAENGIGVSGVAPLAQLASWVIFDANDNLTDEDHLSQMWQYGIGGTNSVAVQNHSWGNSAFDYLQFGVLEDLAISNSITLGRGGLGTILIRSSGNTRSADYNFNPGVGDANLDQYAADPRQITVASVRTDGQPASYSTPGACILVATLSGDADSAFPGLVTTGRVGGLPGTGTLGDYLLGNEGFWGTSASAPLVSGVAALILSVQPQLTWRDVQALLAFSSRQPAFADPDVTTNGAGFKVSHNLGFGVPDAGLALRLATLWQPRPSAASIHLSLDRQLTIPDDGLRLIASGVPVPLEPLSIPATGSLGIHPDLPTSDLSLVEVDPETVGSSTGIRGKAVLVRGVTNDYARIIQAAADGGALAVMVANGSGDDDRRIMPGTTYLPVPSVMVGRTNGIRLSALLGQNPGTQVHLELNSAEYSFTVTNALVLQHARVRLNWQHPRMSDVRVTLRSPSGTVSVLHRPGAENSPVVDGWTYSSTHYLGETSLGNWTVAITDEARGVVGSVQGVELTLDGVPIVDSDHDGLDDDWELRWFGHLRFGPEDDPDMDGLSNAVEQWIGSNPARNNFPLRVNLDQVSSDRLRLTWPGVLQHLYQLEFAPNPRGPYSPWKKVVGHFPEAGLFFEAGDSTSFYRVRDLSSP